MGEILKGIMYEGMAHSGWGKGGDWRAEWAGSHGERVVGVSSCMEELADDGGASGFDTGSKFLVAFCF